MNQKFLYSFFFTIPCATFFTISSFATPSSNEWEYVREYVMSGAQRTGTTMGIKITHNGVDQIEDYAQPLYASKLHLSRSVAKSITSLLFGIAEGKGLVSKDDYLKDIFPLEFNKFTPEDRALKETIQLKHLLDMTSGIKFTEDYVNPMASDTFAMIYGRGYQDMGLYTLMLPSEKQANEKFYYSSGNTNLVLRALQNKMSFSDYAGLAEKNLMDPLNIKKFVFEKDHAQNFIGSSQFYLSLEDFHKLGLLMLHNGKWGGTQVIPESYVKEIYDVSNGGHTGYGLGFWKMKVDGEQFYYMAGFDGQFVIIYPAQNIVVTRLGNDQKSRFDLNYFLKIIKSVAKNEPMKPLTEVFAEKVPADDPFTVLEMEEEKEKEAVARFRVKELCSCLFVIKNTEEYCQEWSLRNFPAQAFEVKRKSVEMVGATWKAQAKYVSKKSGCLLL